jgi:hypothetical protein
MKALHRVHRLAIIIGLAVTLTFTFAQSVSAACTTKERYTNDALATAGRLSRMSRLETRDAYMKSAYASLAKAQAQKCANQVAGDRWAVADSWLGVYAAKDRLAPSQPINLPSCKSLHAAEAREGLALSWLELVQVQAHLAHTATFQRALAALRDTARALSVRVPPLTADRAATDLYIKSSVEAATQSSRACSDTLVASQ